MESGKTRTENKGSESKRYNVKGKSAIVTGAGSGKVALHYLYQDGVCID